MTSFRAASRIAQKSLAASSIQSSLMCFENPICPVDFAAQRVHKVPPDFSRLYRVSDRGHIRIRRLDFITPQDTVGPA
jgi:hypothetical protein